VNPAGGFWIGTMSRRGGQDVGAGTVYQYRSGMLETVLPNITIPNSTCFSPDGRTAYFADTTTTIIRKCPIDPETGLPAGEWTEFARTDGLGSPDGAVVDSEGYLWSARWGGSAVVRHAPDGSVDRIVELPVSRVTCPCLGGDDLRTLYITTAREHMTPEELEKEPLSGSIFSIRVDVPGQPETLLKV
jgi:sugar lactone lactonase YvrE